MNKKDVQMSEDLQIYLQECAEKSDRLYHFTTLESILCIIRNHSFRLTRMDLMNDKAEKNLGNQRDQSKNYVMSYTRDKEYVSMWAMYGNPSGIKLRLDFDRRALQRCINDNFFFDSEKNNLIDDRLNCNDDRLNDSIDRINDRINDRLNLSESENAVLEEIKKNPLIKTDEIAWLTRFSMPTVSRAIKSLREKGIIEREGSKKTGHWAVK